MRLLSLTVRNFRGFGPNVEPIDLDGDLVLLYGPNGHGKTSLAEAIEWLFYGTTKRRIRGEDFSKAEYANTFANAHGGTPTEVSLRVRFTDREFLLSRRLGVKEASATYIDNLPADFSAVGIVPREAYYPVVAQHGLQTFVHSKPKDRRDAICAALGLDELTSLKSALESAKASFQRTPPQAVVEARKRLAALTLNLGRLSASAALSEKWSASTPVVDAKADEAVLLAAAANLVGLPVADAESALAALRTERARASQSLLDITPIEPRENHNALRDTATEQFDKLNGAVVSVDDAVGILAGVTAASYSAALLSFWQEGLTLSPVGEDCPMCEEPTLSPQQRDRLTKRLETAGSTVRAAKALDEALGDWQAAWTPTVNAIAAIGLKGLDSHGRDALSKFLGSHAGLPAYLNTHDVFIETQRSLGNALRADKDLCRATKDRCSSPDGFPSLIQDRQASRDALKEAILAFDKSLSAYEEAWANIVQAVSDKIAADDAVAIIDAVGKALKGLNDLHLLDRYAVVIAETQSLIREVEATAQTKQAALLQSRGQEVKALYALLNPGASVGFEMMEPANDSLKLHATSFGTRMPAAANLSECQLNCLGLAVWLMRATTDSSPFGFILLDDPVQAMDDDHTEAFIAQVVPHLLDKRGKQIVVLSHVKNVIDKLRNLNIERDIRHYHYENFELGGPVIVRQLRLQQMLAEIKGATNGNEANRLYAVDRLRVLLEAFIRELHLQKTGQPAPIGLDTANSGALTDLFRAIPDTEPTEHAGMKDTVRFCDPAHHTQTGYTAPLKSNIQPHIDRVSGMMKKYGLIT
jgi:energy-coupling factor transporter ATP-binding protein EcfA2